jgi:hypothetical protein
MADISFKNIRILWDHPSANQDVEIKTNLFFLIKSLFPMTRLDDGSKLEAFMPKSGDPMPYLNSIGLRVSKQQRDDARVIAEAAAAGEAQKRKGSLPLLFGEPEGPSNTPPSSPYDGSDVEGEFSPAPCSPATPEMDQRVATKKMRCKRTLNFLQSSEQQPHTSTACKPSDWAIRPRVRKSKVPRTELPHVNPLDSEAQRTVSFWHGTTLKFQWYDPNELDLMEISDGLYLSDTNILKLLFLLKPKGKRVEARDLVKHILRLHPKLASIEFDKQNVWDLPDFQEVFNNTSNYVQNLDKSQLLACNPLCLIKKSVQSMLSQQVRKANTSPSTNRRNPSWLKLLQSTSSLFVYKV